MPDIQRRDRLVEQQAAGILRDQLSAVRLYASGRVMR